MIKIKSSHSGDYLETEYGQLTHTNGHFELSGLKGRTFWIKDLPDEVGRLVTRGSAELCSVSEFDIPALESWIVKRRKKNAKI